MRKWKELAHRLFELEGKVMDLNTFLKDHHVKLTRLERKVFAPVKDFTLNDYAIKDLRERLTSLEARVAKACPSEEQLAEIAKENPR